MSDSPFPDPVTPFLPLPFLIIDPSGTVEEWNPAAEILLGWSREEVLGRLFPAVSSDSLKLLLECPTDSALCRVSRKDGTRLEIRIWRKIVSTPQGHRNVLLLAESLRREKDRVRDSDLLRTIMTGIPDKIYFKDRDSRFLRISRSLAQWFRLDDPQQAVGKSDFDFFTREHAEDAFQDEGRVMETGEALVGKEERETWQNGTITWASTTKVPLFNREGETIGTCGISRDITQRRFAEQALRESEQRFRALVRNAGEVIGILESDGRIRYVSDSLTRVLGYSAEEKLGQTALDVVHPADRETVREAFSSLLQTAGLRRVHCRLAHKGGNWRTCHVTAMNLIDDPALHGIVVNVRDMTEFRRMEGQLEQTNELLETVFSSIHVAIAYLDTRYNFIRVNTAYAKAVGCDPEYFIGKNYFELHPDPENHTVFQKVVETGTAYFAPNKPVAFPGAGEHPVTYWDWSLDPVVNADGKLTILVLSLVDVSKRTRAEQELEISREDLRRLSGRLESAVEEERRRIAHELHDELGQSLTALRMELSSLAKSWLAEGRIQVGERVNSLAKLVSGALDTIRRISHELRPAVLDHLGLEAALEWQCREFEAHSRIHCLFHSDMESVQVDQERSIAVFRILQEALTNVARHARAREVNVLLGLRQDSLIMEVRDDGRGMDTSRVGHGSSLGILGMKERAGRLSGEFTISAEPGRGTTLKIDIPLTKIGRETLPVCLPD